MMRRRRMCAAVHINAGGRARRRRGEARDLLRAVERWFKGENGRFHERNFLRQDRGFRAPEIADPARAPSACCPPATPAT